MCFLPDVFFFFLFGAVFPPRCAIALLSLFILHRPLFLMGGHRFLNGRLVLVVWGIFCVPNRCFLVISGMALFLVICVRVPSFSRQASPVRFTLSLPRLGLPKTSVPSPFLRSFRMAMFVYPFPPFRFLLCLPNFSLSDLSLPHWVLGLPYRAPRNVLNVCLGPSFSF